MAMPVHIACDRQRAGPGPGRPTVSCRPADTLVMTLLLRGPRVGPGAGHQKYQYVYKMNSKISSRSITSFGTELDLGAAADRTRLTEPTVNLMTE